MAMTTDRKYDVGGVMLDRPFKIRRLGHFGFNSAKVEDSAHFYLDLLGFKVSDAFGSGYFCRYGSDHHAFVLFERNDERAMNGPNAKHFRPQNTVNQITWQLQSRNEMVNATKYFRDLEMPIRTEGRAGSTGPGSNYHLYVWDPDEQINELYYGIEQIGWDGLSKPVDMRPPREDLAIEGTHISEFQEIQDALARGGNPTTGYRYEPRTPEIYDVDGVNLSVPFKITRIGPVNLFVDDIEASKEYYRDVMGFTLSEEVEYKGGQAAFFRCDNEHHSMGLFSKDLQGKLGLSDYSSCASFGVQVANYRQLQDAVSFLRSNGVRVETNVIPPELHPGIDYSAYAFDPEGHCIELYYYMEQVGWDGQIRPQSLRRKVDPNNWPKSLEPLSDTFSGESLLGPWG